MNTTSLPSVLNTLLYLWHVFGTYAELEWSWLWSLWQSSKGCWGVYIFSPEVAHLMDQSCWGENKHKRTVVNTIIDHVRAAMTQLHNCTTWRCCVPRHKEETAPGSFEDRRLNVVLVTQLWGSGCLLRGGRVGSVHLQSYRTQHKVIILYRTFPNPTILWNTWLLGVTYGANLGMARRVCFRFLLLLLLISTLFLHFPHWHLALLFLLFLIYKRSIELLTAAKWGL